MSRRRVDDAQLGAIYNRYWSANAGDPVKGDPHCVPFSELQKRFTAFVADVERAAVAVRNPVAPGSAQALVDIDERLNIDDVLTELHGYGVALSFGDDAARLKALTDEIRRAREEDQSRRRRERQTPEARTRAVTREVSWYAEQLLKAAAGDRFNPKETRALTSSEKRQLLRRLKEGLGIKYDQRPPRLVPKVARRQWRSR